MSSLSSFTIEFFFCRKGGNPKTHDEVRD